MRWTLGAAGALLALALGCLPELVTPATALITCTNDEECPPDATCLVAHGMCVRRDSGCVEEAGGRTALVQDGEPCLVAAGGYGICGGGLCVSSVCGDGVLDPRRGEECDDGDANSDGRESSCFTSCLAPRCGDDVHTDGEGCDAPIENGACTSLCFVSCLSGFGDCNADVDDGCECQPELAIASFQGIPMPPDHQIILRPQLASSTDDGLFFVQGGDVFALPRDAEEVQLLSPNPELLLARDIVVQDDFVVWASDNLVARVRRDASFAEALASGVEGFTVSAVATDDERAFFTTYTIVGSVHFETKELRLIAPLSGLYGTVAVDDTAVYFADEDSGVIGRAAKEGSPNNTEAPEATILADEQNLPRDITVDAGWVYWGTDEGFIRRVHGSGGDVEDVALGELSAHSLVVREGSVWWASTGVADQKGVIHRKRLSSRDPPAEVMRLDGDIVSIAVTASEVWVSASSGIHRASR